MTKQSIIIPVKKWLEQLVIGLNLCPFAKQVYINEKIHFAVSLATTEEGLLMDLHNELQRLEHDENSETSLLIHPYVLTNFYDYNDFLDSANNLIIDLDLEGNYQIASFHPDYQFANTQINDAENYTNRSPYPLLHIIREKSLEHAIANYPHPELIPERNITLMNKMGHVKLQTLFQSYFEDNNN
jgi:hypothetical protein